MIDVINSLGVEFIDMPAAFQSSVDPLDLFPFRRRGHYNEAGHRLVVETVLQTIASAAETPGATAAGGGGHAIIAQSN